MRSRFHTAVISLLLLSIAGAAPGVTPSPTPTPLLGDANCDGRTTAADFTAVVIVAADGTQLPECAGADPFRDLVLTDQSFEPLFADLFNLFAVPFTPTPSRTATIARTPTRTPSRTPTPSHTATPTPTDTATSVPTPTATPRLTPTRTPTRPPTITPTPTGIAYALSGDWFANWGNQLCYLAGVPLGSIPDTVYQVRAISGTLDVTTASGVTLTRGAQLGPNNTIAFRYQTGSGTLCFGKEPQVVFDYVFQFNLNNTGTAAVHWSYGLNTNCAVCQVDDTATLVRVAGPGG